MTRARGSADQDVAGVAESGFSGADLLAHGGQVFRRPRSGRVLLVQCGAHRSFYIPGGDAQPNSEFEGLWQRFIAAVAEFSRQLIEGVLPQAVEAAGRDLAVNVSMHTQRGNAAFSEPWRYPSRSRVT